MGRGRTWADLFAQFPSVQNESTRTELLRAHFGEVFTGFYAQDHTMIGFHGSASGLELWQGEYLSAYARMNLSWSEVARLVDREIAADIDRFQTETALVVETPPPPPVTDPQKAIDNAIREWNGSIESKQAVVRYMDGHAREKGTAAWLRNEYGDDLPAFPVTSDAITTDIPWPKVQRRIAQLIAEDRFYTEEEQDRFDDIDPIAIREELERRRAQGTSPFVEMVMADVERIAQEEQAAAEPPPAPDLSDRPITRQGDTITVGDGPATHEITATVTDDEWEQLQEAIPEQPAPDFDPLAPAYKVGDTVYLNDTQYTITNILTHDIQLTDSSLEFLPVIRTEDKGSFNRLLRQDARNTPITDFLADELDAVDDDLQDVLFGDGGLIEQKDRADISAWIRAGEGNTSIAQRLAKEYEGTAETMSLLSGEPADYFANVLGLEIRVYGKQRADSTYRWEEIASILRAMFIQERDGFSHEPDFSDTDQIVPEENTVTPIQEIYDQYFPMVRDMVMADEAYINACKYSDRENAMLEGRAAVRRAAGNIDAPAFMRAFYDGTGFQERFCDAVLAETYPALAQPAAEAEPVPQETPPEPEQAAPDFDPLAPPYKVGDTVYLDDTTFEIAEVGDFDVQLRDPALYFPMFRAESRERFETLLQQDPRNGPITEFLALKLQYVDDDLREALVFHLLTDQDKKYIAGWFQNGEGNTRVAQRLSELHDVKGQMIVLVTGGVAHYSTSPTGFSLETEENRSPGVFISWNRAAMLLRTYYQREISGFSHEPAAQEPVRLEGEANYHVGDHVTVPTPEREISGTIGYAGETDVRVDTGPYLDGMTEQEIAKVEGVAQRRISKSISSGKKVMYRFLKKFLFTRG